MGKKIYFSAILLFTALSYYYQFAVSKDYSPLAVLLFIRDSVLVAGGYSLYFNKPVMGAKKWRVVFKVLVVLAIATFIYQVWPTSYYGDFSLLNASFLTNVFVYLLLLCFYLPLFFAVNKLSKPAKSSKKKK